MEDNTETQEWFESLAKLMPTNADAADIVQIIGSVLAVYEIGDPGQASLICVEAASTYNQFLEGKEGELAIAALEAALRADGELH